MKWFLIAVFVLVNAVIFGTAVPGAALTAAADGGTWYEPALALLKHGAFVDLNDPTQPQTYRPPLFPLFAAAVMAVTGGPSLSAIVVAQIIVLLLTALIVYWVVENLWPGRENLALGLTLFNPNALSTVHLVQSDTLFTFFLTLFLGLLLVMSRRGITLRQGAIAGVALGAACLVRPTAQFLIIVLPVLLVVLALFRSRVGNYRRAFGAGVLSALIAVTLVLPWALHMRGAGEGFALTSPKIEYRYVWDQVQMIDSQFHGRSYAESGRVLEGAGGPVDQFKQQQGSTWDSLDEAEQWRRMTSIGYREFLEYPLIAHAKTWLRSQVQFFFAAGAGNFQNLLGVGAGDMARSWFGTDQSSPLSVFRGFVASTSVPALIIMTLGLAFTVAVRFLDLAGLALLVRERDWSALLPLLTITIYFAMIHIYVGNSRYRLAIDPALMILATLGYGFVRGRVPRTRIFAG